MAKDCIVTKLKASINNPSLPYLNELRFFCVYGENSNATTNTLTLWCNTPVTLKSIGYVNCLQITTEGAQLPDSGYVSTLELPRGYTRIAVANMDCEFYATYKYELGMIDRGAQGEFHIGLSHPEELDYNSMYILKCYGLKGNGIINFKRNFVLQKIVIPFATFGINIDTLNSETLNEINLSNTPSVGSVNNLLQNCPALTSVEVPNLVTGSMEEICEILASQNKYSLSLVTASSTAITIKSIPTSGRFTIESQDNGITYSITNATDPIGVYNTQTHSWEE